MEEESCNSTSSLNFVLVDWPRKKVDFARRGGSLQYNSAIGGQVPVGDLKQSSFASSDLADILCERVVDAGRTQVLSDAVGKETVPCFSSAVSPVVAQRAEIFDKVVDHVGSISGDIV